MELHAAFVRTRYLDEVNHTPSWQLNGNSLRECEMNWCHWCAKTYSFRGGKSLSFTARDRQTYKIRQDRTCYALWKLATVYFKKHNLSLTVFQFKWNFVSIIYMPLTFFFVLYTPTWIEINMLHTFPITELKRYGTQNRIQIRLTKETKAFWLIFYACQTTTIKRHIHLLHKSFLHYKGFEVKNEFIKRRRQKNPSFFR